MRRWIYFLLFLPLLLFAEKQKEKVELVSDFGMGNCLFDVQKALQEKEVKFNLSKLKGRLKSDDVRYYVVWNKPHAVSQRILQKLPRDKAILFMWEPPSTLPKLYSRKYLKHFKRIYTWDDDLVDNKRYFKFYYPVLQPMLPDLPSFEEKKLCSFMFSNKRSKHPKELYSEREKVVQFFEDKPQNDFEFYGKLWEQKGYKNYRGAPVDKIATLKNYRFSICYENIFDVKGYITEKIFDCFAAGTIPIYWGASNVQDYIPENCFIDRRKFKDNEELYVFLKSMDAATYNDYLDNIRAFLKSDKAQLFSTNMFTTIFLEAIRIP